MREYVTDAIILSREETGEQDARYSLFTRDYGRCVAKGKSVRKITSRLAAHLEPGTVARVRLVENKDMHVVDALRISRVGAPLPDLARLHTMIPEWEPDEQIWEAIVAQNFSWQSMLSVMGWGSAGAACAWCGARDIAAFHVPTQDYVCPSCVLSTRVPKSDMIYL